MQIQKIHIENFGKLHDLHMDLNSGLNVICASNGWGKTTLAAFLKAMLYGLDYTTKRSLKENERKKYAPWQGGAFGGSMEFAVAEKCYRVERFFGAKDKEDTFVLYDLDTGLESSDYTERLGEELFRLDRAAFERSSFFMQQDFASSINDSLNARLSHVEEDAGDMQNYEKAVASLEDRMKYYQKTGNRGLLGKLEEERRQVREQLMDCRNKEQAASGWKTKLSEKEQTAELQARQLEELENKRQQAQEYREKTARREQHDFLRKEAQEKEELLRTTGAELGSFSYVPLTEEELDDCRDRIYQLESGIQQGQKAEAEIQEAEHQIDAKQEEIRELPKMNIGRRILMSFSIIFGITILGWKDWYIMGGVLLLFGLYIGFSEHRKGQEYKWRSQALKEELAELQKEQKKAKATLEQAQNEQELLAKQLTKLLHLSEKCDLSAVKEGWNQERQRSRRYMQLKDDYEEQRLAAQKSREAYLAYQGKFSEEELREFLHLQKPEQDLAEIQRAYTNALREREALQQEISNMRHQLSRLVEYAEQIPELEEEEERISQELEDGLRQHDLLEKTLKYLKTARDQFSTRYLKDLQQGLEHYMAELEPDYESQPVMDVKLKVKVREAGASRDLEHFSAGWQDLIQIAKRFAIVDALYEGEQPVLILDDPFVNLDSEKEQRAKALLQKLSEKWQMIYFTCR